MRRQGLRRFNTGSRLQKHLCGARAVFLPSQSEIAVTKYQLRGLILLQNSLAVGFKANSELQGGQLLHNSALVQKQRPALSKKANTA